MLAACLAAIKALEGEPERIERLSGQHAFLQGRPDGLGFDTGISETPITPVIVGDFERAGRLSARLLELGVFAQAVVYRRSPSSRGRIHTIVSSEHTRDASRPSRRFATAGRELGSSGADLRRLPTSLVGLAVSAVLIGVVLLEVDPGAAAANLGRAQPLILILVLPLLAIDQAAPTVGWTSCSPTSPDPATARRSGTSWWATSSTSSCRGGSASSCGLTWPARGRSGPAARPRVDRPGAGP